MRVDHPRVPGLCGYVSATKWLSQVELTRFDEKHGYWIPRGWSVVRIDDGDWQDGKKVAVVPIGAEGWNQSDLPPPQ